MKGDSKPFYPSMELMDEFARTTMVVGTSQDFKYIYIKINSKTPFISRLV